MCIQWGRWSGGASEEWRCLPEKDWWGWVIRKRLIEELKRVKPPDRIQPNQSSPFHSTLLSSLHHVRPTVHSTHSSLTLVLGPTSRARARRRRRHLRLPLLSTPLYLVSKSPHSPFFVPTSKPYMSLVQSPQSTSALLHADSTPPLTRFISQ